MSKLPRIALTLGDIAGIGPEVVARAAADAGLRSACLPVVIGNAATLARATAVAGVTLRVEAAGSFAEAATRSAEPGGGRGLGAAGGAIAGNSPRGRSPGGRAGGV